MKRRVASGPASAASLIRRAARTSDILSICALKRASHAKSYVPTTLPILASPRGLLQGLFAARVPTHRNSIERHPTTLPHPIASEDPMLGAQVKNDINKTCTARITLITSKGDFARPRRRTGVSQGPASQRSPERATSGEDVKMGKLRQRFQP